MRDNIEGCKLGGGLCGRVSMYLKILLPIVILIFKFAGAGFGGEPGNTDAGKGRLHLTFSKRSPASSDEEICRRTGFLNGAILDEAQKGLLKYDLAGESFEVFVPSTYKSNVPHGLFVWISAGDAEVPPGWLDVFRKHKLIWISANNTGNSRPGTNRMGLALDAVHNMKQLYNINKDRIYISGFSGGGNAASYLIRGYADVFSGGYFMMGYMLYGGRKNEKGQWETGIEGPKWEGALDQIKKNTRLMIMDGEGDPGAWPGAARADCEAFLLDGFQRVSYLEVPKLGHRLPDATWFEKGIISLESKPKSPPDTSPTKDPHPLPGQIAQAKRILTSAQALLDQKKKGAPRLDESIKKYLQRVLDEYPTTPAAEKARQLLDELNHKTK
jgi:predicted esterase